MNSHSREMYDKQYYPFFVSGWSITSNGVKVHAVKNTIHFAAMDYKTMSEITSLCSGLNTLYYIKKQLLKKWDSSDIEYLFDILIINKAIVNIRDVSDLYTEIVSNPSIFVPELNSEEVDRLVRTERNNTLSADTSRFQSFLPKTETGGHVAKLLTSRKSCRSFSGKGIQQDLLSLILWSAYGIQEDTGKFLRRTTPSGGALYPISISLILLQDCGAIKKGIYEVLYELDTVHLKPINNCTSAYYLSFSDWRTVKNSTGIIALKVNYRKQAVKYGSRSIQVAHIEAGHIAQNINLICQDNGLGTLEVGGFRNECMARMLNIKDNQTVLHTILFGVPSTANQDDRLQTSETIVRFPRKNDQLTLPYIVAYGRIKEDTLSWSSGKSDTLGAASQKLISEIIDWRVWNTTQYCTKPMRFNEDSDLIYLDPKEIVTYADFQYQHNNFNLEPFDEKAKYSWLEAYDLGSHGQKILVLADHALFPYSPSHPRYTFATSSGSAAHLTLHDAISNAVFEVVERDAFMIYWLNTLNTPVIDDGILSDSLLDRLKNIRDLGFEVIVRDINMGIAPVFLVAARLNKGTYLTCGTSSGYDVISTIEKALTEVEVSIIDFLEQNNHQTKNLSPQDVVSLSDHEKLYQNPQYSHFADFMFERSENSSDPIKSFEAKGKNIVKNIQDTGYRILVIDATDWKVNIEMPEKRYVVKVILPGLVPLSFGYMKEPLGMDRIYETPVQMGYKDAVDTTDLNLHPHPFN